MAGPRDDTPDPERADAREQPRGWTRRNLFKGAGLAAAAAAPLLDPLRAMAQDAKPALDAEILGSGAASIVLSVNGENRKLKVEPRRTLLDALRLDTHLTGTKTVCDRGQCGACTILLDDQPVYACTVLAVEAVGSKITTVEGLGTPDAMSSVQSAFCEHDALQCGFCTPGFVVACTAAVRKHGKNLTDEQVRRETSGNLCRCGTYNHVIAAALQAAKEA